MGQTTAPGTRCGRCSAAVRPGAPWCTQCCAPTGDPAPQAVPEQRPAASVVEAQPPSPTPPPSALPAGTWPCTTCSHANDLALAACGACGTSFLAAARDTPPTVVLPVVGDLLVLSPARRTVLAVGVVIAFVVAASLLALLLA